MNHKKHIEIIRKFIEAEKKMRQSVFSTQPTKRDSKLKQCDVALDALREIEISLVPVIPQEDLFHV